MNTADWDTKKSCRNVGQRVSCAHDFVGVFDVWSIYISLAGPHVPIVVSFNFQCARPGERQSTRDKPFLCVDERVNTPRPTYVRGVGQIDGDTEREWDKRFGEHKRTEQRSSYE